MIEIHTEVAEALAQKGPVVALESTIIAHGMPYPENRDTALELETLIREGGAVPATIAIIHGKIKVGLNPDDLEYVATHPKMAKASRRDMGYLISQGASAATTVAATMIGARMAGISLFATGGIGGVHRGAEQTFDISADLQELAKSPVAVISAGAKAILDLPLTLEYLETMGVPVIGVGTDEFPAFYTRQSGIPIPARLDDPAQIAHMLHSHWQLGLESGVLIANPIPESDSMDPDVIEQAIQQAISEADEQHIRGKALTPFLLGRIKELTQGHSLVSNIALVRNNAMLAAKVAVALSTI